MLVLRGGNINIIVVVLVVVVLPVVVVVVRCAMYSNKCLATYYITLKSLKVKEYISYITN